MAKTDDINCISKQLICDSNSRASKADTFYISNALELRDLYSVETGISVAFAYLQVQGTSKEIRHPQ